MAGDLTREETALVVVQATLAGRPGVLPAARALSHFGEHSAGWIGVAALGAAVVIKRVVKRERPNHPAIAVNVATPSRLSFPSAHATSTTAASILLARATGAPLPVMLVPPMALSRVLLGVHYPSDVATGVAVGAAVAGIAVWVDGRIAGGANE